MHKMRNYSERDRSGKPNETCGDERRWHSSEILLRAALLTVLLTFSPVTENAALIQNLTALAILLRTSKAGLL
jgi:hypothetical protein